VNYLANKRWALPNGTLNLYADFANGNDANDGLTSGAAKKTVQNALETVASYFDIQTVGEASPVVINMAANVTDTQGIHFAPHGLTGAHGTAAVKILGGTGSKISTSGVEAVALFYGAIVRIENVKLEASGSACLLVSRGAKAYIKGIDLGAAARHIQVNTHGMVEYEGNNTVSANASYCLLVSTGGLIQDNGYNLHISHSSAAFTDFINVHGSGSNAIFTGTVTFAGTVTGRVHYVGGNAFISTPSGSPGTYFPGNATGVADTGGQIV
jgi:hypothetical protein